MANAATNSRSTEKTQKGELHINLVEFLISSYFLTMQMNSFENPKYHEMMQLARAILLAEEKKDDELIKQIEYIEHFTDPEINIPLSSIHLAIQRNAGRGTQYEIEVHSKIFTVTDLHRIASHTVTKLTEIVVQCAKKYSLEIIYRNKQPQDEMAALTLQVR